MTIRFSFLLGIFYFLLTNPIQARPPHLKAVAEYIGPTFAKKLNDCLLCHLPDDPKKQSEEEKAHNLFGIRLVEIRKKLKEQGKKSDIVTRLETILEEDSDRDGVNNLVEILTGHFPGDEKDKPTSEERSQVGKQMADWKASKTIRSWSAFNSIVRSPIPTVHSLNGVLNPIDAFISFERNKYGLKPRPEAKKEILLRRVYLDLIGLPPTRQELHDFLADTSLDAYEKVVDKLLRSPQYGEAQARHWMDIWRYSDWAGFGTEVRDSQPHIWRWRDWIVESLNQDKGYDQMIREMLAADEIAPLDRDTLRATGFLVRNWYLYNRQVWLDRAVEHTSKAFLGLTINCARCHDHFYDPISQQDYYAFRAIFEPHDVRLDKVPGKIDPKQDGLARVYDKDLKAPTYLFVRGNDAQPETSKPISPTVPKAVLGVPLKIEPISLPKLAFMPDRSNFVMEDLIRTRTREDENNRQVRNDSVLKAVSRVTGQLGSPSLLHQLSNLPYSRLEAYRRWQVELESQMAKWHLLILRSEYQLETLEDFGKKDTEEWKNAAMSISTAQSNIQHLQPILDMVFAYIQLEQRLPSELPKLRKDVEPTISKGLKELASQPKEPTKEFTRRKMEIYPSTSTGRRLALAKWITNNQNPLTARVAVNHLWLRRFGSAIVPTVFDFGKNGLPPTHPALLDWLAMELMENGWSLKHIHRTMVLSSTYRMDSTPDQENLAKDPDNRFYWRMNNRRMTAETVRDSVLFVSGELDSKMTGPDIDHTQGMTVNRRSLYFRSAPEKQMEFLSLFDGPNVVECYSRSESVVPQQALALANSPLVQTQSRLLGRKLSQLESDSRLFTIRAFEMILSRMPTLEEEKVCLKFLEEQTELLKNPGKLIPISDPTKIKIPSQLDAHQRARESLIHVLLNHNDFVSIR